FLNINERGHLKLTNVGDTFDILPFRTWQLVESVTNNYMIEPDFHFSVLNLNGQPDNSVVTIENEVLRAKSTGTANVLVTYDAIDLRYYNNGAKAGFVGAEHWGAIWPENTGVFVVTVGEEASLTPNMTINVGQNSAASKLSGDNVDAEHDVFYYLDTTSIGGAEYTFKPTGVSSVQIAYPTIGSQSVSYSGFSSNGVTLNADGSYTLLLREGSQIIRLTDMSGKNAYQILRAKPCHREITIQGREFTGKYLPGDVLNIQYSGLYHPANKLGGIYNMSAFVQYRGTPNGTNVVGTGNQYQFAATPSAQAFTLKIPDNFNTDSTQVCTISDGKLQISGFGDPIGNHRNTSKTSGRSPNFTALSHTTVFGKLPDFDLPLMQMPHKYVKFVSNVGGATISVTDHKNYTLTADANNVVDATIFNYTYKAKVEGYNLIKGSFSLTDASPDTTYITLNFETLSANSWDGKTLTEPAVVTTEESETVGGPFEGLKGYYKITSGYEMAWFANAVNSGQRTISGCLANDISLAEEQWTRIGTGTGTTAAFQGKFDGLGHTIDGLYILATTTYQGLFGGTRNATIKNLTVKGEVVNTSTTTTGNYQGGLCAYGYNTVIDNCTSYVDVTGRQYVAGIVAYGNVKLSNCVNYGNISGSSTYIGGIAGQLQSSGSAITRCANFGNITTATYYAGGLVGSLPVGASGAFPTDCYNQGTITGQYNIGGLCYTNDQVWEHFFNCYNVGEIYASAGDRFGSIHSSSMQQAVNCYAIKPGANDININYASAEQFASGEVAWKLGKGFTQKIGTDPYPTYGSDSVYRVLINVMADREGVGTMEVVDSIAAYYNSTSGVVISMPSVEGYTISKWDDNTTGSKTVDVHQDIVFNVLADVNHYDILAAVNDGQMGSVSGSGNYRHGEEVVLRAIPAEHYHFVRWSNDSTGSRLVFAASKADTITAIFAVNKHEVSVGVNNIVYGSVSGQGTYDYGTEITLTATPAEGCHFTRWADGVATAERTVRVDDDLMFYANFAVNQYQATVLSSDESKGQTFGSGIFAHGAEAEFTAVPAKGYHFSGWSNGQTDNPVSVVVTSDLTLTATFALNQYVITLSSEDAAAGSVKGGGDFEHGEEAVLIAIPAEGYHFAGWSNGQVTDTLRMTVNGNMTLTAAFAVNHYKIDAKTADEATGYVTGSGVYTHGQAATLEAIAQYGYHFSAWSDGQTMNPLTVTATSDITLTALFEVNRYTLTLNSDESMGSVNGSGTYQHGQAATATATPAEGYHFTGWSNGQTDQTISITMTGDITLRANFEANSYAITATPSDATMGSVRGSGSYDYGIRVVLSATAYEGYRFTGWSDGETAATRTVTVRENLTLTANFEKDNTAINETALQQNISIADRTVRIDNTDRQLVSIVDAAGRLICTSRAITIEQTLPDGIYIIRAGQESIKFVIR
ncbi:MAG: InlB B-repeat-containing protein, partial [Paludibacteraceae bacterium]|nr:InlB B-repeat-containing protein [Paludibacteraceae bacterium]